MWKTRPSSSLLVWLFALAVTCSIGCAKGQSTDHEESSTTDAESDVASDAGADTATDSESDTGTDSGSDTETDTEADSGTDAEADTGTDTEADTGTDTGADPCESTLPSGERLEREDFLCSPNGQYEFGINAQGDLVLREGSDVLWSAGLSCCDANHLAMQASDGNLVVYTANTVPLWASDTVGNSGAYLTVEDDGRAVIWNGSREIWWVPESRNPGGNITEVGTTEIYDSNGLNMSIDRPAGTQTGDLLLLFLHRTDDDLPLSLNAWTRAAECLKSNNGDDCLVEQDCTSWHDTDYCESFGADGGGHDLGQAVFYKWVNSNEPSSYQFSLKSFKSSNQDKPAWIILTALRGAAQTDPVRDWTGTGCDGDTDSIFPSVYGEPGDGLFLSQSFDDALDQSALGPPSGTSSWGYVVGNDETGFLFGGALSSTGQTGDMTTTGPGAPRSGQACKDALVSLTIKPQ